MNLYGDLSSSSGGTTNSSSKGSWSGLTHVPKPKAPTPEVSFISKASKPDVPIVPNIPVAPSIVNKLVEADVIAAAPKFVPTKVSAALAFKPRQALQPTTSASKVSNFSTPNNNSNTQQSIVRTTKFSPPVQQQSVTTSVDPFVKAEENVGNEVATFDEADAYDPSKPNDYIHLLDEREEVRQLKQLQRENQLVIEENERIREENAKQRQLAVQSGDYSTLLASSINNRANSSNNTSECVIDNGSNPPMGRGRGRGMINLPAWMTQKMEADASLSMNNTSESKSVDASKNGTDNTTGSQQFADASNDTKGASTAGSSVSVAGIIGMKRKQSNFNKPSNIVLLKNMVSPSEVDDALAEETKHECQKFGNVLRCVIHQVPAKNYDTGVRCPDEERVRMFVVFELQESAVKAFRDMNGRFFGGRKISASFYDEDKFARNDLAPMVGEW